jgi:hypothetical protein
MKTKPVPAMKYARVDKNERRSIQRMIEAFEFKLQHFGMFLNHERYDDLMPAYRKELVALYSAHRALKLVVCKRNGIGDQGPRNGDGLSLEHSHARLTRKRDRR